MATSGSSTYNPAVTFIMTSAYRKLAVVNENEQPTAGMFEDAFQALNSMIKEWEATGIHVWTEEEGILFPQVNQARYLIGGTTTDNIVDAYSYIQGQIAINAPINSTSVTLASTTGISVGQNIGIVLDTGLMQWTTVKALPGSNVVTLNAALTTSASSQNFVFTYTTKIVRPLKIPEARRLAYQGVLETPMIEFSRQEYMDLPNKLNQGVPTAFFYNPARDQGQLYIWPVPNFSISGIRFTWYRPIQDYVTVADTSDFPQEWINALTWNLAVEMAPDFSIPPQRFVTLQAKAAEKLDLVRGWDREAQPIYFTVNYDSTRM